MNIAYAAEQVAGNGTLYGLPGWAWFLMIVGTFVGLYFFRKMTKGKGSGKVGGGGPGRGGRIQR